MTVRLRILTLSRSVNQVVRYTRMVAPVDLDLLCPIDITSIAPRQVTQVTYPHSFAYFIFVGSD
jgi:hypothetical protein